MRRRTANPEVLRLGDEVVGDAASNEEGPQRPENLSKSGGESERHDTEPGQATTSAMNRPAAIENLGLTGVDHLRRPKNAMDEWDDASGVFRDGRRCAWVALECGNFGAHRPIAAFPALCELTLTQMLSSLTPSKTTAAASSTSFAPGVRAFDYLLVSL